MIVFFPEHFNKKKNNLKMKVCGLILARKNSKGIVNKNLSLLDGVPLIAATIRVMKKSNCKDLRDKFIFSI